MWPVTGIQNPCISLLGQWVHLAVSECLHSCKAELNDYWCVYVLIHCFGNLLEQNLGLDRMFWVLRKSFMVSCELDIGLVQELWSIYCMVWFRFVLDASIFICQPACIHYRALLQYAHSEGHSYLSLTCRTTKTKWGMIVWNKCVSSISSLSSLLSVVLFPLPHIHLLNTQKKTKQPKLKKKKSFVTMTAPPPPLLGLAWVKCLIKTNFLFYHCYQSHLFMRWRPICYCVSDLYIKYMYIVMYIAYSHIEYQQKIFRFPLPACAGEV